MKHVLVTGATGVLGSELIAALQRRGDWKISALVRPRPGESPTARLAETLRRIGADSAGVDVIAGDLTDPAIVIDPTRRAELLASVTHVVHGAADLTLDHSLAEARAATLVPTQNLLHWLSGAPRLERFDLISTVGVGGKSFPRLPERLLDEAREFRNSYEQVKAEAETLVSTSGLPLTVHRPSMIVGRASDGEVLRFQVFYYLCELLSGRKSGGVLPRFGPWRLDTIPVDFLATAIAEALDDSSTIGRVLHHCSGPELSIGLEEWVPRVQARYRQAGVALPRPTRWSFRLLRLAAAWLARFGSREHRPRFAALRLYFDYLESPQYFENRQTLAYYRSRHLALPEPREHLERCLDVFLSRKLTKPSAD